MARVKFTAWLADARGKENGTVFSRNASGAYTRNKVTPVNPNTAKQSAVRTSFSALSKAWGGTLTESERQSWIQFARQFPFRNIFGDQKVLSGLQMFMKLNQVLNQLGVAMATAPPLDLTVSGVVTLSLTATSVVDAIGYSATPTSLPGSQEWYVFATPPMSPGKNFVKSEFRFMNSYAAGAGPTSILTEWEAAFGDIGTQSGKKVFVLVAGVDPTTGATSVGTIASTLII